VLGMVSANDCGRAINPRIIENQIDLSLIMANGWVRTEDFVIDKSTGVVLNPNLDDYQTLGIMDKPSVISCGSLVSPAITNATWNMLGLRMKDIPTSGEKILAA